MDDGTQPTATGSRAGNPCSEPAGPTDSPPRAESPQPGASGLLAPAYRSATVGIVGLVSIVAFEAMGSATIMPAAAGSLDGLAMYGFLFGGPLAVSLLGMVAACRWSDQHGPMHPVWIGSGCFVAGLLIAALAGTMGWLLLGRLVTGLGSGMVSVALYALVGRVYPPPLHSGIFGAFAAAWMLPALVGPGLAGLVAQFFGWRYGLLATAALALPVFAMLGRLRIAARETPSPNRPPAASTRILWALCASGAALALHYLGQSDARPGASPHPSPLVLVLLCVALALLAASARRLLPAGTLTARRGLPAAIALNGLSQGAFFAAEAFLPLLLHREKGATVGLAGLVLSAGAVSWSAAAFYRARFHERIRAARLLRYGFILLTAGILLSALVLVPGAPMPIAIAGWVMAGAGMGLISPTLSVTSLSLAPTAEHGFAGASLRLSAALTTTSVLALSGAVFALLLVINAPAAFAISLASAGALAVTGALLAGRVALPVRARERSAR